VLGGGLSSPRPTTQIGRKDPECRRHTVDAAVSESAFPDGNRRSDEKRLVCKMIDIVAPIGKGRIDGCAATHRQEALASFVRPSSGRTLTPSGGNRPEKSKNRLKKDRTEDQPRCRSNCGWRI
jgi:hypothetical protein